MSLNWIATLEDLAAEPGYEEIPVIGLQADDFGGAPAHLPDGMINKGYGVKTVSSFEAKGNELVNGVHMPTPHTEHTQGELHPSSSTWTGTTHEIPTGEGEPNHPAELLDRYRTHVSTEGSDIPGIVQADQLHEVDCGQMVSYVNKWPTTLTVPVGGTIVGDNLSDDEQNDITGAGYVLYPSTESYLAALPVAKHKRT